MKILKVIGVILIAVVFVVSAGLLYINSGLPQYPVPEVKMQVVATAARIERGRKLSAMLCNSCHLNPTKGNLTGKRMSDAPAEFGIINSRNITQHKEEGIGDWSDAEIAVLLRTGINPRRGGVYVPPYMPKLAHLSDEDLASIISYLRSDDPILKADGTPSADSQPSFLVKFLCRVAFTPLEFPKSAIAQPDSTNARALGKYLADGALDCYGCHSADFKTV
ncbi:MAG: cytochrome c, partial [Rhizobacter sp.]|nr:cytochrome c [Chlorobiales bacterium]